MSCEIVRKPEEQTYVQINNQKRWKRQRKQRETQANMDRNDLGENIFAKELNK